MSTTLAFGLHSEMTNCKASASIERTKENFHKGKYQNAMTKANLKENKKEIKNSGPSSLASLISHIKTPPQIHRPSYCRSQPTGLSTDERPHREHNSK